jgi:hypothetical protein
VIRALQFPADAVAEVAQYALAASGTVVALEECE